MSAIEIIWDHHFQAFGAQDTVQKYFQKNLHFKEFDRNIAMKQ